MHIKDKEFLDLIVENKGILYKISKLYESNRTDQEDLRQELMYQLWKSYDLFRGESKFSTWMYRICLNTAITFCKKKSKCSILFQSDYEFDIPSNESSETEIQVEMLYRALHQLDKMERAFMFMYLEGFSHKEIGESIGISEGNARVRLNRIKNKLKLIIKKQ